MKTVYFEKVKHLLAEMFAMKKHKQMNKALAVLSFIVTIPFFVAFLGAALSLLLIVVLFEVLETPAKYLDEFLTKRGGEVKTATQCVVYFFAWPVVFALKAIIAVVTLVMNVTYVATAALGYVWTLGGFKFHLSILEEGYELKDVEKISKGRPLGFVIAGLILLVLAIAGVASLFVLPSIKLIIDANTTITLLDYIVLICGQIFFGVTYEFKDAATVTAQYATLFLVVYSMIIIVVIALIAVYAVFVVLYNSLAFNNGKKSK